MAILFLCLTLTALLVSLSVHAINIEEEGDILQCNWHPFKPGTISELSEFDEQKVDRLEFVQALFRHGIRMVGYDRAFNEFFPDAPVPEQYEDGTFCDLQRSEGNKLVGGDSSSLRVRLKYAENEQLNANTNCENEQALYESIPQMRGIADVIRSRYIAPHHRHSNERPYTIFPASYTEHSRNVALYATDFSRIRSAAIYFAEQLLGLNDGESRHRKIDLILHDVKMEPFRQDDFAKCLDTEQWQQWQVNWEAATKNMESQREFENSLRALDVKKRFEEEGGRWVFGSQSPWYLDYHYCAGLEVPLSRGLYQELADYALTFDERRFSSTKQANESNICYFHQQSRSAYQVTKDAINDALFKEGAPRILAIASHGPSIRQYLWGLDLFDDRKVPVNAEMVTLEVYSAKKVPFKNIGTNKFYFRWTRSGQFLPYKPCADFYRTENTELCDLSVLMDGEQGFGDAVPINEFVDNVCGNAIDQCLCGFC